MSTKQTIPMPTNLIDLATLAHITLADGYQWLPAHRLSAVYHPTVEVELPLFLSGITDREMLIRLAQTLANAYPAAHQVTVIHEQAERNTVKQCVTTRSIGELATGTLSATDTITNGMLCVPPLPAGSSFAALQAIVAHLRSPVGCPWDREQTLMSMRHDLLGECAEVLEAIDHERDGADNGEHIAEELGDLFMAGVLILQIAIDAGRFHLADAMQSIVTKLIRRHPHVFGDVRVDGVDAIWANWDAIKAQEKAAKGQIVDHPLDGVPAALPALEKAREYQSKAQKAKLLDRTAVAATWEELCATFHQNNLANTVSEAQLGQLLWALVAVAHQHGLNAEDALRSYAIHYKLQI